MKFKSVVKAQVQPVVMPKRKYQYKCTHPEACCFEDSRNMEAWLDFMDTKGWEFIGYSEKHWLGQPCPQYWWIFRKTFGA